MRTASKVLGIVGGAIALILAVILIVTSITFRGPGHPYLVEDIPEGVVQADSGVVGQLACLVTGCIAFTAGVLGLVGGLIIKKKNKAAGAMMIVAAVISPFSYYNFISTVLFILGAIFALKKGAKERRAHGPAAPSE